MTKEEIEQFKKEFKKIVWLKGQITSCSSYISKLEILNKNDSHEHAINNSIKELNEMRQKFKDCLKGYLYQEWKDVSKKISVVQNSSITKKYLLLVDTLETLKFKI